MAVDAWFVTCGIKKQQIGASDCVPDLLAVYSVRPDLVGLFT